MTNTFSSPMIPPIFTVAVFCLADRKTDFVENGENKDPTIHGCEAKQKNSGINSILMFPAKKLVSKVQKA